MKIYPNQHNVCVQQYDAANPKINGDVFIAYTESAQGIPSLTAHSYNSATQIPLIPYTSYIRRPYPIFLENGMEAEKNISDSLFQESETEGQLQYVYDLSNQSNTVTYSPNTFDYYVIGKRIAPYDKLKNYYLNIKIGNNLDDGWSDAIKSAFYYSNAESSGFCPSNIIFNENDEELFTFENGNAVDFYFTDDIENDVVVTSLPQNTNIWVIIDDAQNAVSFDTSIAYSLSHIVYDSVKRDDKLPLISTSTWKELIDDSNVFFLSSDKYAPICIKEDTNKQRYIIYSPLSLFTKAAKYNKNIIIEHIMRIYLRSYIHSNTYTSWISNPMPDYTVKQGKLVRQLQVTSGVSWYELLGNTKQDVELIDVYIPKGITEIQEIQNEDGTSSTETIITTINDPNISYSLDLFDTIIFSSSNNNINIPDGMQSIYCNGKIIVYKNNYYLHTSDLTNCMSYNLSDDGLRLSVNIKGYTDSINGINILDYTCPDYNINDLTNGNIYIATDIGATNYFYLSDNELNPNYIYIGYILFKRNDDVKSVEMHDLRRRGGGAPKNARLDTQCLFDIGSEKGMSYRMGGSVVIQLPKAFKEKDDIIRAAVQKHLNGSAYAFITYY